MTLMQSSQSALYAAFCCQARAWCAAQQVWGRNGVTVLVTVNTQSTVNAAPLINGNMYLYIPYPTAVCEENIRKDITLFV